MNDKKIIEILDNLTVQQTDELLTEDLEMDISDRERRRIEKLVERKISSNPEKMTVNSSSPVSQEYSITRIKTIAIFKNVLSVAAMIAVIFVGLSVYKNMNFVPFDTVTEPTISTTETTIETTTEISTTVTKSEFPKNGIYEYWLYTEYEDYVVLTDYQSDGPQYGAKEVPETIYGKPVTDIAEKCLISLLENNIMSFAIDIGSDSPYFTVERPSDRNDVIIYDKDKTTLIYASIYYVDSYELPKTVTAIYDGAFVNIGVPVTIEDGNENFIIEDGLLMTSDKTRLITCADRTINQISYKVPDTVTKLDVCVFYNMGSVERVTPVELPEGLKEIPPYTFSSTHIYPVKIPESVEIIGEGSLCFNDINGIIGYENLEITLTIPKNVREIGLNAFYFNNDSLKITIDEENQWYSIENHVLYNKDKTVLVFANDISVFLNGYKIPDTVKVIKSGAIDLYANENGMTINLDLPASLEEIEPFGIMFTAFENDVFIVNGNEVAQNYMADYNDWYARERSSYEHIIKFIGGVQQD